MLTVPSLLLGYAGELSFTLKEFDILARRVTGHCWTRCNLFRPPSQGYGEATGQQQWWIELQADDLFT